MRKEQKAELQRLKRQLRQEVDAALKQIEDDLELTGDIDLAIDVDRIRHELHTRLIIIGEEYIGVI